MCAACPNGARAQFHTAAHSTPVHNKHASLTQPCPRAIKDPAMIHPFAFKPAKHNPPTARNPHLHFLASA